MKHNKSEPELLLLQPMKIKLLLLLFCMVCCIDIVHAQQILQGKIVRIADGDTVTLLDSLNQQHKIRLHGIDCPERHQDFHQVARDYVGELCYDKQVKIEVTGKDRYQRILGKLYLDQQEINLLLLQQGLAWHYTQFDKSPAYAQAEREARLAGLHIWSLKDAMAPWLFRKQKRDRQKSNITK